MNRRNRFFLILVLLMLAMVPALISIETVDAQILGSGWTGSFFNNTTLSGTPIAQSAFPSGLSCVWNTGAPTNCVPGSPTTIPNVPPDNFSATFQTTETFAQAGNYRFTLRFNDGIRLRINGATVYESLGAVTTPDATEACIRPDTQCREVSINQFINAGPVQLQVDYIEFTGVATLQVQWGFVGGGGTTIPGTTPTGPTATPVPAATGQVIRVRGLAMRTGPYLGASLVNVARPERVYPILERNRDEGLFVWYKIAAGDSQGWVSGRYFEVSGNIEAIPFTNSIFDQIDDAPDIGVTGVTRAIMNMRRRPSERTQIIDKIPWGAEVPVVGRTIQAFDEYWLQVRYNGKVGWIFAPYVGLRGIVDAVPVR
jgi:uncharacterized protein YraI